MNKNNNSGSIFRSVLLVLLSVFLSGCDRDRNNPGWDYFPDMFYTAAYKSFSKNPNFSDGMTMRTPPEGTVPRDFTPFEYTPDPESRIKAGKELVNPLIASPETVSRGKKAYTTFCIGCHGAEGDGNGHLFTSNLYPLKPRTLVSGPALELKDGEIYHSITLGFGSMGAHGGQIRPEERWQIISYIKTLHEGVKGQITTKNQP